jgi:hypothetical protein
MREFLLMCGACGRCEQCEGRNRGQTKARVCDALIGQGDRESTVRRESKIIIKKTSVEPFAGNCRFRPPHRQAHVAACARRNSSFSPDCGRRNECTETDWSFDSAPDLRHGCVQFGRESVASDRKTTRCIFIGRASIRPAEEGLFPRTPAPRKTARPRQRSHRLCCPHAIQNTLSLLGKNQHVFLPCQIIQ